MVDQEVAALQHLEDVGELAIDDRQGEGGDRLERDVLQVGAVDGVQLHEAGQVQGRWQRLDGVRAATCELA